MGHVYHRFNQWSKKGVWNRLFQEFQDPDLEWLFVDSTVVWAHQHAAGLKTGGEDQDLGRSVGGFSTKLHMAVDSHGNPVAMHLSPGQAHDLKHALDVIGELQPEVVAMDKAYDSEPLMDELRSRGIEPSIPPKKPETAAGVRPAPIPGTLLYRTSLQPTEAVPPDRDAVREVSAKLPEPGHVREADLVPIDGIKTSLQ